MNDVINELKLSGLSVFTARDVSRLTGKSLAYAYLFVSKSRLVERVEKGLYAVPGTDPFEIASSIMSPAYISLASAFSYYRLITQLPMKIKIVSNRRHRPIKNVGGFDVEFRHVKKSMMYGYYRKSNVVIAYVEKAVIDALYFNEDIKYIDEAIESARSEGSLDDARLRRYASQSGSKKIKKDVARILNRGLTA
jgi:predicted transcriptional regulator of viral defense system